MKILMVHPHDIHSESEPWTVRITYIAKEFVEKGHRVKLAYFPLWGRTRKDNEPVQSDIYEEIPLIRKKSHIGINTMRMYKLARWADIVHFQKCFSHASLPALFAGYLKGKPIHYDWDDWEMQIYNYASPDKLVGYFLDYFEKTIPRLVNTVSVASKRLRQICRGLGVSNERIFDAPVGADTERIHPDIDAGIVRQRYNIRYPLVMYLGQLHGAQYAELFIKSTRYLLSQNIEADFMIVGDGARAPELKHLCDTLGLNKKLIFTGGIPHQEVPYYLSACDIAVACFEDNEITRCKSPLKIVEYMAAGKPIVASDVGEVRTMTDGSAILTKAGDVDSLCKGIKELLDKKELRYELAGRARQRAVERYNWSTTAENILRAYRMGLEDSKR